MFRKIIQQNSFVVSALESKVHNVHVFLSIPIIIHLRMLSSVCLSWMSGIVMTVSVIMSSISWLQPSPRLVIYLLYLALVWNFSLSLDSHLALSRLHSNDSNKITTVKCFTCVKYLKTTNTVSICISNLFGLHHIGNYKSLLIILTVSVYSWVVFLLRSKFMQTSSNINLLPLPCSNSKRKYLLLNVTRTLVLSLLNMINLFNVRLHIIF